MIIFSNYYEDLEKSYDDAREYLLDEHDEEPSDDDIWDYIYEEANYEYDDIITQIMHYLRDTETIFVGSVGRWDGTFDGGDIDTFETLYYKAIKDCDYIKFEEDDNEHLYLTCSHHDGTNCFEIRLLTDKGMKFFDDWNYNFNDKRTEQEVHTEIMKNKKYSTFPCIRKMLGWIQYSKVN